MEWPKWLDDFPYEEPGLDDKKRRKWLLSTKLLLVSAVLGMLAGLDELRAFPS